MTRSLPLPPELAARYVEHRVLGSGAQGTVYRAEDRLLGRTVALKLFRSSRLPAAARRFQREAMVLARCTSPHLLAVYDHGETPAGAYMVLEFVAGGSAESLLDRPRDVDEVLPGMLDVVEALECLHRAGVVHRDVKSENIFMVARDPARAGDEAFDPDEAAPGELRPILMDFGLAHSQAFSTLTESGMMIGTVPYMSPEQAAGEQELTPASDVYSLGVVLYEALTGERPIVADTSIAILRRIVDGQWELPSRKVESIPVSVDSLIQHMMSLRVIDRPQNAGEVAQLIEDLLAARDAG